MNKPHSPTRLVIYKIKIAIQIFMINTMRNKSIIGMLIRTICHFKTITKKTFISFYT